MLRLSITMPVCAQGGPQEWAWSHCPFSGSHTEGWTHIPMARFPAMGKEEISIVLHVPP